MGGVQKEFFQSIVERVFDPAVGMFEYSEETRQFSINPRSLESQYAVSMPRSPSYASPPPKKKEMDLYCYALASRHASLVGGFLFDSSWSSFPVMSSSWLVYFSVWRSTMASSSMSNCRWYSTRSSWGGVRTINRPWSF